RREGFRSVAAWMASKTGAPVGTSITTLEMAAHLDDLPLVAEAFRAGRLSEAQMREIVHVASEVPGTEGQLLTAAETLSLKALREECRRVEAAAAVDADDRYRQIRRSRDVRSWVDRHGVGHMSARMTPDDLARLMNEVDRRADDLIADAVRGGWFEGRGAHRLDALVDMARPARAEPAGPENMIHVMVDFEALKRGHTEAGEQCEIPGFGPIPVTLARQMSEDAILKVLLTDGVDVKAVAHWGRTIPAHLRSAVEVRDRKCIVPRCDRSIDCQIDHRNTYGRTRVTRLEDLALLCRWHHYQKTFLGYTYRGGPGSWEWIPPEDLDVDLSPFRRIVTSVRRC
ncbi:MAG TPA: DUF222 domain-containing protein, partial [Acidimicrobiia bacterium]|nr:DUF222 domain-containing protein [Acidimicrobiia bacterium]